MSTSERVQSALTDVLSLLCSHPRSLVVHVTEATNVTIQIEAHPQDCPRIVGTNATKLRALIVLARLLTWDTGRMVVMNRVSESACNQNGDQPVWDSAAIVQCFERLGRYAFTACDVSMHDDGKQACVSILLPGASNDVAFHHFNTALTVLCGPIGYNLGRVLSVDIKKQFDFAHEKAHSPA